MIQKESYKFEVSHMLRLTTVFASRALFLHSAPLTVKGTADGEVAVRIEREGKVFSEGVGTPGGDGFFAVTVTTPAASFDPYRIVVLCGGEEKVLEDILFGELWLAGGQSNMELPAGEHLEWEELRRLPAAAAVRSYHVYQFPFDDPAYDEQEPFGEGNWYSPDEDEFGAVSMLAFAFSLKLAEKLGCPVGFLNLSRGCSRIETWLPRHALTEEIIAYQKTIGRYPTPENWNTAGEVGDFGKKNFNQLSAYDRRAVYALSGISLRGVLWYQGCSNAREEWEHGMYEPMLRALRSAWEGYFGVEGRPFPFLVSTLYPYPIYKPLTTGYVNCTFAEIARSSPDEFMLVTNADLSPRWALHTKNYPVHPIHKQRLGERFADVALFRVYGVGKPAGPAMLVSSERRDGALYLTFSPVYDTLSIKGERAKGIYVSDKDGHYLPAECEIVAQGTLRLSHPGIPEPREAAYSVLSTEVGCNLFANGVPLASFFTASREESKRVVIEERPWSNLSIDSDFQYLAESDASSHAVYRAFSNSGFCYDRTDTLEGPRSLRVYSYEKDAEFGVLTTRRPGAELDLGLYRALRFSVYPASLLDTATISFTFTDGKEVTVEPTSRKDAALPEWCELEFSLSEAEAGMVRDLAFSFRTKSKEVDGVNIDRIYLVP